MAKDIKAIQCPKCSSTSKKEIKPDFYQCQHCQTEYFLDSDDRHIYHHHNRVPPLESSAPPVSPKLPIYILIGAVACIIIVYLLSMLLQPQKSSGTTYSTYKMPRSYYSNFVYTNTATGDPVYLRIGVDYINKDNNKSEQELHAQFNNVLDGKLLADRIIDDEHLRNDRCALTFKSYSPTMIYAIGCKTTLLQLDTRNNRLNDITKSTFKDYPKLSSGVAKLDFDYSKPMINVMSNDGETFYYFPGSKRLVTNEKEADAVCKELYKNTHYFEFGYLGDRFSSGLTHQLIEISYPNATGELLKRELTPGRKYFDPAILYQDRDHLLIAVNTTAAPDPPISIQKIDVKTGEILWALTPDRYYLTYVSKCKQGFAIEYRKDADADYVHGVLVVSDAGKLVHNYQLGRTE